MKTRKTLSTVLATVLLVAAGYSIGRADSPFPDGGYAPVLFSGNLTAGGTPTTGAHDISLNLWRAPATTNSLDRVCEGATNSVTVDQGSFQIALDPACVAVFDRYTQVWYELVVDGTAFPLQQIGAVPYAMRSGRDFSNGARLSQKRDVVYGSDGYRGTMGSTPLHDEQRHEDCSPAVTVEGKTRCLPRYRAGFKGSTGIDATGLFLDDQCTTAAPTTNVRYFAFDPGNPDAIEAYVADTDADYVVQAVYPATAVSRTLYTQSSACTVYTPGAHVTEFTLGAAAPLSDFVELQTKTE